MTTPRLASGALPAEQRDLIAAMNDRRAPIPPGTVADQAIRVAAANRDRVAVVSPRETLTYGQVLDHVTAMAQRLLAAGVGPGDRVVLSVELGWEQLVGALAIMRTGSIYVPVSPHLPQHARWDTVAAAGATVVVTQWWLTDRIVWPPGVTVLAPDAGPDPGAATGDGPDRPADRIAALLPDGARGTGRVPISHDMILNTAAAVGGQLGLRPDDRVLALAPVESALSLHEMILPVLAGATVVFSQDVDVHRPRAWLAQLERDRVTTWLPTPALLNLLLDHLAETGERIVDSLRAVVISGERLNPARVGELRSVAGRELTMVYAAAAAPQGAWVALCEVTEVGEDWRSVPIGRPLANQRLYVLSETGEMCPVWVTGRVHVGGLAAADPPALPLVPHPESGDPLVRTDMFGRLRADGLVEVVGDESSRILVHGRPLNLRDAETALDGHEAVRQAVMVPAGEPGGSVGFARVRTGLRTTGDELLRHLRRKVSPYLLPDRIELMDALPLTTDGRVDREALRAAALPGPEPETSAVPPTADDQELTRRITAVACRLFDLGDIDPNVNLTDIGVTSYQLVRLATVLQDELDVTVEVEELLRFPSISVIVSSHLAAAGPGSPAVPPVSPVAAQPRAVPTGDGGTIDGILERQAFKDAQHGIRTAVGASGVVLTTPADDRIALRRTTRSFDAGSVGLADLATLLGGARMIRRRGEPKFWYPSAGGAYPVQIYLLVAAGRVRDLAGGSYYYHPADHRLVLIDPEAALPASAHLDINRMAYRQSAFSLYLIGRMRAITPLYGELSWDFTVFEAGALAQVLGQVAAECGLGLCTIGTMDATVLAHLFRLDDGDRFVHALLGGPPDQGSD